MSKKKGEESLIRLIKDSKTADEIKDVILDLEVGNETIRALHAIINWTHQELTQRLPTFSSDSSETDESTVLPVRKGLIALGVIAKYNIGGDTLLSKVNDFVSKIVVPIFQIKHHKDNWSLLGLKVETLATCTLLLQAYENSLVNYVPHMINYFHELLQGYVDRVKNGDKISPALSHVYAALIKQCSECVLTQIQIDRDVIQSMCDKIFANCCLLLDVVVNEVTKTELAEIIHQLGYLAITPVDETLFWTYPVKIDEDDDIEDKIDFLDRKQNPEIEKPLWNLPNTVTFSTIASVTKEALRMYDLHYGVEDYEPFGDLLTMAIAISAQYFTLNEHIEIVNMIMETIIKRLNFADNFAQPVLCDLRACLMYAKEEAVQPHFDELYTRLQQLHSTAKAWIKTKATKRAKIKYNKFRTANIGCFGTLLRAAPQAFYSRARNFLKETAPLFADPLLLSDFVIAVHNAKAPDAKELIEQEILPTVMKQLLGELPKEKLSWQVKSFIIESMGRIAVEVGSAFEPYADSAFAVLHKLLCDNCTELSINAINCICMILEGTQTCSSIRPFVCESFNLFSAKCYDTAWENVANSYSNQEGDFPEELVDLISKIIYKVLCAMLYFIKTPALREHLIASFTTQKFREIVEELLRDIEKERIFEDDIVIKIVEAQVVFAMLAHLPSVATDELTQKATNVVSKAFPKDSEELAHLLEEFNLRAE